VKDKREDAKCFSTEGQLIMTVLLNCSSDPTGHNNSGRVVRGGY